VRLRLLLDHRWCLPVTICRFQCVAELPGCVFAQLDHNTRQDIAFTQREWSSDAALACCTTRRQRRH
jgi:hypothetical protein